MSRTAAGRAGGRRAAHGPASPSARASALLRTAVLPLVAATVALASPVPASAAPPLTTGTPQLAAPQDDATDPDRPISITVARFEPRSVTPNATITVTGTLTNTGTAPITDLSLRLQRGEVRTTREELDAALRQADPATTVLPDFHSVSSDVAPGKQVGFTYSVSSADLRLTTDGVYPVVLNVNGTVGGTERRVGELATFVVRQPVVPAAKTTVAWLWPVTEPSHRTASGAFADDRLTASISTGGRLDRILATLERLPRTLPAGGTEPLPSLPVTLAVDPALVEELSVMAAGNYAVNGVPNAGRGTAAAAAFLERLRALAAVHHVVALPYGDIDADSLTAAGLGDVVPRSLPGSDAGTARDPAGRTTGSDAPATTTPAAATTAANPAQPAGPETGAGARILETALKVTPRTDLAWAPGGTIRADTLATLQAGGIRQVVLGTAGLTEGETAVGRDGRRAAARTTVKTAAGPLDVLVADSTLGDVVGSAEHAVGGPRMAEQRYLAELAVLTLEAKAGSEQTVLVAPPRMVEAGPDGAGAMMADTSGLPWLRPGSVEGLSAGPSVDAGTLAAPPRGGGLDAAGMAEVRASVRTRDDLAGAVVGNAAAALQQEDAAIARTSSADWRGNPEGFRAAAAGLHATLERLRGRVTLLAPADGTYSLASHDAPLVLTVRNDLPFAVTVLLDLRTRGSRGLSITDIGKQTLPPGRRTTLQVPTTVQQSGGFAVTAALTTPSGGALGERVEMQVKSNEYGSISLLITLGSAALLGLLFLRRLVRFVLRRRRGTPPPDGPPLAGSPVTAPTTRSPV